MAVRVEPTPNPNATKFTVGRPVGGPGTFVKGSEPEESFIRGILDVDGVSSVFLTADFVTVSKTADGSWDSITPEVSAILDEHFDD